MIIDDRMIINNHCNQDESKMGRHNDNKQFNSKQSNRMLDGFTKQVVGLFGDTLLDFVFGMVFLVGFGLVVNAIWYLVNKVL